MLNTIHGGLEVPAPLCALYVMHQADSLCSFKTAHHQYGLFMHRLLRRDTEEGEEEATMPSQLVVTVEEEQEEAQAEEPRAHLHFASVMDDYDFRPTALHALPPYLFTMLFVKKKRAKDAHLPPQYPFTRQHPQHRSHYLAPRPHPVVPQITMPIPWRPPQEGDPDQRDRWAAGVLGNFASDEGCFSAGVQEGQPRPYNCSMSDGWLPGQLWDRAQAFLQDPKWADLLSIVRPIIDNMQQCSDSHHRSELAREQAQQAATELRSSAAVHRRTEHLSDDERSFTSEGTDDSDEDQSYEGMGADRDALEPVLPGPCTVVPRNQAGDAYLQQALAQLPPLQYATPTPGWDNSLQVTPEQAQQLKRNKAKLAENDCEDAETDALARHSALHVLPQGDLQHALPVHQPNQPAFDPGLHPQGISPLEAAKAWDLDADQGAAFLYLAATMLDELKFLQDPSANPEPEQLRMLIMGSPGTGKTRGLMAFEWWLVMNNLVHHYIKSAYTWRAAEALRTAASAALSTCTLFKISHKGAPNTRLDVMAELQNKFADTLILALDEFGMAGMGHGGNMSTQAKRAICSSAAWSKWSQKRRDGPFGGIHYVFVGDPYQHRPVRAKAFWDPNPSTDLDKMGREIFQQIKTVLILSHVHRQSDSDSGKLLKTYVSRFCSPHERVPDHQVDEVVDALNQRVITPEKLQEFLTHPAKPRVMVLRNLVRGPIHEQLACAIAKALGKRVTRWHSHDTVAGSGAGGKPLVAPLQRAILELPASNTRTLNGQMLYFEGCPCVFCDNADTASGRTKNSFGFMHRLLTADDEPPDQDPNSGERLLSKVPAAIEVLVPQPIGAPKVVTVSAITQACRVDLPYSVVLPNNKVVQTSKGPPANLFKFQRKQIPLGNGTAVTDFFVQVTHIDQGQGLPHMSTNLQDGHHTIHRSQVQVPPHHHLLRTCMPHSHRAHPSRKTLGSCTSTSLPPGPC